MYWAARLLLVSAMGFAGVGCEAHEFGYAQLSLVRFGVKFAAFCVLTWGA